MYCCRSMPNFASYAIHRSRVFLIVLRDGVFIFVPRRTCWIIVAECAKLETPLKYFSLSIPPTSRIGGRHNEGRNNTNDHTAPAKNFETCLRSTFTQSSHALALQHFFCFFSRSCVSPRLRMHACGVINSSVLFVSFDTLAGNRRRRRGPCRASGTRAGVG